MNEIEKGKLFTLSTYTQSRGHSLNLFKHRARLNVKKLFLNQSSGQLECATRFSCNYTLPQRV